MRDGTSRERGGKEKELMWPRNKMSESDHVREIRADAIEDGDNTSEESRSQHEHRRGSQTPLVWSYAGLHKDRNA